MRITGTVIEGKKEGRALGYPTANLQYALDDNQELAHGIYAGRVFWNEGSFERVRDGAIVVGGDFENGGLPKFEVFILDFDGDLYGVELTVELLDKIRDMRKFEDQGELIAQIKKDVDDIHAVLQKK